MSLHCIVLIQKDCSGDQETCPSHMSPHRLALQLECSVQDQTGLSLHQGCYSVKCPYIENPLQNLLNFCSNTLLL